MSRFRRRGLTTRTSRAMWLKASDMWHVSDPANFASQVRQRLHLLQHTIMAVDCDTQCQLNSALRASYARLPEQREPQWKSGRLTYCHHACRRRALSPQSQSATLKQSIPIRNAQQTTVGPSNLETLACLRHTTDKATTDDKVQVTFAVRGTSAPLDSNKLFALEAFCVMVPSTADLGDRPSATTSPSFPPAL